MKIGIGNDHSALELKAEIIELLKERGHEVVDYGTNSPESCDYPVYGEKVGRAELIITAIFLPLVRGLSVQNWLR